MRFTIPASAALLLALTPTAVLAHASLEISAAAPGSYKAVIRIPHGCDGEATHTVRVDLPEGFISAKPMPKAGWTLETEKGAYERSYTNHGNEVSEGVTAVTWSGGDLADEFYDEFVIAGTLAGVETGDTLAFKTTQLCAGGQVVWDEIAAEGQDPHALEHPAPSVTVLAAGQDGHGGHGDHQAAAAPEDNGEVMVGNLAISGAWTRAMLPGQKVGGGYLTIVNNGVEDDRLVSLASPVTDAVEIHEMAMNNDIMTMRKIDGGLAIPTGETVTLAPGGLHLMFQNVEDSFAEGDSVPVTLTFEKAGEVTLTLPVLAAGSREADSDGQHHQH